MNIAIGYPQVPHSRFNSRKEIVVKIDGQKHSSQYLRKKGFGGTVKACSFVLKKMKDF